MDLVYAEQSDVSMEAFDVSRDFSMYSNEGVFSTSDSDYDRSLEFQQRDFENVFFRNEIWRVSETWLDWFRRNEMTATAVKTIDSKMCVNMPVLIL